MSPELVKGGTEGHDFSVDWWSVGVLTYELLTGTSPFTVDGEHNNKAEIAKRILKYHPPIPEHLTPQAQDFLRRLLVKDPSQRLGGGQSDASQLKEHPFLATINWTLLAQRKLRAPFKPKIRHELDVSNFAEEFTSMAPHILVCNPQANQITTTTTTTTTTATSNNNNNNNHTNSNNNNINIHNNKPTNGPILIVSRKREDQENGKAESEVEQADEDFYDDDTDSATGHQIDDDDDEEEDEDSSDQDSDDNEADDNYELGETNDDNADSDDRDSRETANSCIDIEFEGF